jgi:hypothetical protein
VYSFPPPAVPCEVISRWMSATVRSRTQSTYVTSVRMKSESQDVAQSRNTRTGSVGVWAVAGATDAMQNSNDRRKRIRG